MIAAEGWIAGALAAAAILLFAWRVRLSASAAPVSWGVRALTEPQAAAILCGAMLGWAAPGWIGQAFGVVLLPGLAFFAGWTGVAAGCGLDLRAIRGGHVTPFLYEAGAALAAVLALFSASLLGEMIPAVPDLGAPALFVLAALCVVGPAMAPAGEGSARGAGRAGGGMRSAFREPSILAVLAVLLAAVGTGLAPSRPFQLSLPGLLGPLLLPMQLESLSQRLAWGVAAGCLAGFLADLSTRVGLAPGRLYLPLAAVVLLAVGISGGIGVEALLVGTVAGFWLINATLRRLDILGVLDRGARLPRVAVPFLAAWLAGSGLRQGSFDAGTFLLVALGVIAVRPVVRLATARVVEGGSFDRRRRGRSTSPMADRIVLDELGLLIGVQLVGLLHPDAGVGGMAGVLAGALCLGAVRCWWGSRREADGRAPAPPPEGGQAGPASASRPG